MLSRDKDSKEREREKLDRKLLASELNYRLASVSRDALRMVPETGPFLKWNKYSTRRNWREGRSLGVFH